MNPTYWWIAPPKEIARVARKTVANSLKTTVGAEETNASFKQAKEIMCQNLFAPEDATRHLKAHWTHEQLSALAPIPFSERTLEACKDTHVLVAGYPLTLLDIRDNVDQRLFRQRQAKGLDDPWYDAHDFARKTRVTNGWHLIQKAPVSGSFDKCWSDKHALLATEDEVPSACVMVYTIIGHLLKTGERLFNDCFVYCSDCDARIGRVYLGYCLDNDLMIDRARLFGTVLPLGLACSRKPFHLIR